MNSLELLYEEGGLPAFDLPDELAVLYGGTLGFDEPRVFANFVATVDGVVAIPSVPGSNKLISDGSAADRFVMGLLRACADALVIGSGTLIASPRSVWTPEQAFPDAAEGFADLRGRLGRDGNPEVVVLSASGRLDPAHPAFAAGALVLTTDNGASRLDGLLPEPATLASLGAGLDPEAIVGALRERGHRLILSEGGPHAFAPFLAAGLIDELFLTVSPRLVGRPEEDERLGLVEGVDLLPGGPLDARLIGVRRDHGHLFLRYELA
jgi:riboflavin biosynthesis pyrimidine reductase